MKSSVTIKVNRSEIMPKEGRVEWLEKWGVIPESIDIEAEAELADWAKVTEILDDGRPNVWPSSRVYTMLSTAIAAELRKDPTFRGVSNVTEDLLELAAKRAAEQERDARMQAEANRITAMAESIDIASLVTETGGYSEAYSALEGAVREKLERNWKLRDLISERKNAHKAKERSEREAKAQAYVLAHPDLFAARLVRAAEERRFVRAEARESIRDLVRSMLSAIGQKYVTAGEVLDDLPGSWEDDNRPPEQTAYMLRDELVAAIPSLESAIPGSKVAVSDFGRGDVASEKKEVWRSMLDVIVQVDDLSAVVGCYVLLEPLDYEIARDDDEEE